MQPYNYQRQNQEGYRFIHPSRQVPSFVYSPYNTNTNVPFASSYKEVTLVPPPSVYHQFHYGGSNLQYLPTPGSGQQLNSQNFSNLSANSQQTKLSPVKRLTSKISPVVTVSSPSRCSSSPLQYSSPLQPSPPLTLSSLGQCYPSMIHALPQQQPKTARMHHSPSPTQTMEESAAVSEMIRKQRLSLGVTKKPNVSSFGDFYSITQQSVDKVVREQCYGAGDMKSLSAPTTLWEESPSRPAADASTVSHSKPDASIVTHSKLDASILTHSKLDASIMTHTELDASIMTHSELDASTVVSGHASAQDSEDFEAQLTSLLQQIPELPESASESASLSSGTRHRNEEHADGSLCHTTIKQSDDPEMTNSEASKEFIERAAIHGISIINPKELKAGKNMSVQKTAELKAEIFVEKAVNCGITVGKCKERTRKRYCPNKTWTKLTSGPTLDEMAGKVVRDVMDKVVLQLVSEKKSSNHEGTAQCGENVSGVVKAYSLNPNIPAFEPRFTDSLKSGQFEKNNAKKQDNFNGQSLDSTTSLDSSHTNNTEAESFVFKFTASSPSCEQDNVKRSRTKHSCGTGSGGNSPLVLSPNLLNEEFKLNENNSGKVDSACWRPDKLDIKVESNQNKFHFADQCINTDFSPRKCQKKPCTFISKGLFANRNSLFAPCNENSRSCGVMTSAVPVASRHIQTDNLNSEERENMIYSSQTCERSPSLLLLDGMNEVHYVKKKEETSKDCQSCEENKQRLMYAELLVVRLKFQVCLMELERQLHELTFSARQWKQFFVSANQEQQISHVMDHQIQYLKDEMRSIQKQQEKCVKAVKSGLHLESLPTLKIAIPRSTGLCFLGLDEDAQTDKTPDQTNGLDAPPSTSNQHTWATWQTDVPCCVTEPGKQPSLSDQSKTREHHLQSSSFGPDLKLGKRTYSSDESPDTSVKNEFIPGNKPYSSSMLQDTHSSERVEKPSCANTFTKHYALPKTKTIRAGSNTNSGDGEMVRVVKQRDTDMDVGRILKTQLYQTLEEQTYQLKISETHLLVDGIHSSQNLENDQEDLAADLEADTEKLRDSTKNLSTSVKTIDSSFTNLETNTSTKQLESERKDYERPVDNGLDSASNRASSACGLVEPKKIEQHSSNPDDFMTCTLTESPTKHKGDSRLEKIDDLNDKIDINDGEQVSQNVVNDQDDNSVFSHSVSKRTGYQNTKRLSVKTPLNWKAYDRSINSKESSFKCDFITPHAADSTYLKLIDDATDDSHADVDTPSEFSCKDSFVSGYSDIDLDQLVRQAKNVLSKCTTDENETASSTSSNEERQDCIPSAGHSWTTEGGHLSKDSLQTLNANVAWNGTDIGSDEVQDMIIDDDEIGSYNVDINRNINGIPKCKITTNIPQTSAEAKFTETADFASERMPTCIKSDVSMIDESDERSLESVPAVTQPGGLSQAAPSLPFFTSLPASLPASNSATNVSEQRAIAASTIASLIPGSSSTSANCPPHELTDTETARASSPKASVIPTSPSTSVNYPQPAPESTAVQTASASRPTVSLVTPTVSSSTSVSLPPPDSTVNMTVQTASVPISTVSSVIPASSTSVNYSQSIPCSTAVKTSNASTRTLTVVKPTSSSTSVNCFPPPPQSTSNFPVKSASSFVSTLASATPAISSSISLKESPPELDSTSSSTSTASSVSSSVIYSTCSELSLAPSSQPVSPTLKNSSTSTSLEMSNQSLESAIDSQISAIGQSTKNSISLVSDFHTVVSSQSSPAVTVNSQPVTCNPPNTGVSSACPASLPVPELSSGAKQSYSEASVSVPLAGGKGANAPALIVDSVLFQVVMTQLAQAYPQLTANPQMFKEVCLEQTILLQSYMHGSDTSVNHGTAPVTQPTIPALHSPLSASEGNLQTSTANNRSNKTVDSCEEIDSKGNRRQSSSEGETKVHSAFETNFNKIPANLKDEKHNTESNSISIKNTGEIGLGKSVISENKSEKKNISTDSHTAKSDKMKKQAHVEHDPVMTFDPSLISNDCCTQISATDVVAGSIKESKPADESSCSPAKNVFDLGFKSVSPLRKPNVVAESPRSKPLVETISADLTPKWFDSIQPLRRPTNIPQQLKLQQEDDLPESLRPYILNKRKRTGQEARQPSSKPTFSAVVNAGESVATPTTAAADSFKSRLTKLVKTVPKENPSSPSTSKNILNSQAAVWKANEEDWNTECDPYPKEFKCVFNAKRSVDLTSSCPKPLKPLLVFSKKKPAPKVNSTVEGVDVSLSGITSSDNNLFTAKENCRKMDKDFLSKLLEANKKSNESKQKKLNDKNGVSTKSETSACEEGKAEDVQDSEQAGEEETWQKVSKKKKREHKELPKVKQQPLPSTKPEAKKNHYEKLVLLLQSKFPQLDRSDAIDVILQIRGERGVLSGLTVNTIIEMTTRIISNKPAPQPPRVPTASPALKQYAKLDCVKSADEEGDVCAICCDELVTAEVNVLDCGHQFHITCIRRWLLGHERTCPTCRRIALLPDEFPKLGK